MTFFVTLAVPKSAPAAVIFPPPRCARSTFFTLFNATEVADLDGSQRERRREGNPIFYMEMCKWHSCLSLVLARVPGSWDGRRVERDVRSCKRGDVICFNFLLSSRNVKYSGVYFSV